MPADLWCLGGWEEVPKCMKQRLKVETYISQSGGTGTPVCGLNFSTLPLLLATV